VVLFVISLNIWYDLFDFYLLVLFVISLNIWYDLFRLPVGIVCNIIEYLV
jgi:hypothetical protein